MRLRGTYIVRFVSVQCHCGDKNVVPRAGSVRDVQRTFDVEQKGIHNQTVGHVKHTTYSTPGRSEVGVNGAKSCTCWKERFSR